VTISDDGACLRYFVVICFVSSFLWFSAIMEIISSQSTCSVVLKGDVSFSFLPSFLVGSETETRW